MNATKIAAQQNDAEVIGAWAETPPMGWNSWDCYGPTVVEKEVKQNADYMAEHLLKYGWEYVVVDIRWFVENDKAGGYNQTNPIYDIDEYGRYIPAENRFPSAANGVGFKALADYCHDKGLKFGIHIMRGLPKLAATKKCPVFGTEGITCDQICNNDSACTWLRDNYKVDYRKKGAQEYYNSIFNLYASWGVDYVKVDDIARPYHTAEIEMIHKAIMQCGRPMVLSLSPGETPLDKIDHLRQNANLWRTVDDFWDNWSQLNYQFGICAKWAPYIQEGHWPDADMLPLGRLSIRGERGSERWTNFTEDEQYTLMNLWTIFKSPLMFGGELTRNDNFTNSLLTNEDVLYMHHYSKNNRQVSNDYNHIVWAADAPEGQDKYVALFNTGGNEDVNEKAALYRSGTISYLTTGYSTDVSVDIPEGSTQLLLVVTDGGDGYDSDHADWINPTLVMEDGSAIQLTTLTPTRKTCGWGNVQINKNLNGGTLSINNKKYTNGIATHANSQLLYNLPKGVVRFTALAGIDNTGTDQGSKSSVEFLVFNYDAAMINQTTDANAGSKTIKADPSRSVARSGFISKSTNNAVEMEADIAGAEKLYLLVSNGGDNLNYDHADWGNPVLVDAEGNETSLTTINWDANPINGWYTPKKNTNNDGNTMKINGVTYKKGFGVNAPSLLTFTLPENHQFVKFKATVGYDDDVISAPSGVTMEFFVYTSNPASETAENVVLDLTALGFETGYACKITDMWTGKELGTYQNSEFAPLLRSHASGLYRITPVGGGGIPDAIDAPVVNPESKGSSNDTIYNLSGQRLRKPRKGVNIVGGKKVVVK
ncbi:MAG: NPCBM/NEW2 domain-containing protein [Bacteroides sp.]|nr:NPCBM/NEW2 domain-containing protein [Roseburia sp.]MCM1347323.1 NPCBM/NEW2 domain-containing protein [Bacteroides sp.]MCM1421824.1 NPCBM/NEW2 domain-containing protein [Bacteroides sp.]